MQHLRQMFDANCPQKNQHSSFVSIVHHAQQGLPHAPEAPSQAPAGKQCQTAIDWQYAT